MGQWHNISSGEARWFGVGSACTGRLVHESEATEPMRILLVEDDLDVAQFIYTPSGGAVTVRLQTAGQWVSVTVEDTGHGIESAHLPHLFERFYRTDWARAKDSGGTGLGLPIVKEIVEAHDGAISVTSQVDKGSAFVLRFPAPS